jgi:hypothetical protein
MTTSTAKVYQWKRIAKTKQPWIISGFSAGICLETEKNTGQLSTGNRRPEEDQEPLIEQKRKYASTATEKNYIV